LSFILFEEVFAAFWSIDVYLDFKAGIAF